MNNLIILAVFSVFSFNLVLTFGLGTKEIFESGKQSIPGSLLQLPVMFITIFVSWLIFTFILSPLSLGFLQYFLLFPLTVFLAFGIETSISTLIPGYMRQNKIFSLYTSYSGLIITALILTLYLADTVMDAFVLSFCLSFSAFFAILLLRMIKLRGKNEKLPSIFSGQPILLISMALLSLVSLSIAYILVLYPLSF
jgi:electron transport complex protein RnfA